ncbi:MAG: hypothetical protein HYW22_01540 [Candidatus Aenigmarchaeota archaeon]|nr:hypothetical protein [Candidatus Aenigmarchaeota archaeon]
MKGISEIIAAVMIVTITIGLTSTAYIWGAPLIQKRQDATVTERVLEQFSPTNANSLGKVIENVANNKGTESFTTNADGIWVFDENEDSITFTFTSKSSNIASTQNSISLTPGVSCTPTPSPVIGIQGVDSSSVVCVNATNQADFFRITYKLWFRELDDNPSGINPIGYKINLVKDPSGLVTTTGKTLTISYVDSTSQSVGSKTLITKQIKILLI